jgi:hypothetical protein
MYLYTYSRTVTLSVKLYDSFLLLPYKWMMDDRKTIFDHLKYNTVKYNGMYKHRVPFYSVYILYFGIFGRRNSRSRSLREVCGQMFDSQKFFFCSIFREITFLTSLRFLQISRIQILCHVPFFVLT